jgi:hypothetical protein
MALDQPTDVSIRQLVADSGSVTRGLRQGRSYTLTLNGEPLARMIPIRRRRAVPKEEVLAIFATAPVLDVNDLRADLAVVDTSIIAAIKLYDPAELPDTLLITAVTLGELSYGPHATEDPAKRAGRVAVLQHVEATFDPLPYDQSAARLYGQICAAVRTAGRQPRSRASDLMIAATAASNELPLYTANPDDFKGTEGLVAVVAVHGRPNDF